MNNKHVYQAVKRYLSSDDPFSLQINGAWGTGKTYFVRNEICKNLNKMTFGEKKYKYLPIYISLNEINSISELKKRIRNSLIIESMNNNVGKSLFSIFSFLGSDLSDFSKSNNIWAKLIGKISHVHVSVQDTIKFWKKFMSKPNEKILYIFDDLERTGLSYKKLIGFISNFIDQVHCKTIIVSNECEYKDYIPFVGKKEKIISKVVHFGDDSINVAEDILRHKLIGDSCKDWNLNISNRLLLRLKDINIRTIYCIISTYNLFSKEVAELTVDSKLHKQLLKTGYISIFTLMDANRRNGIKDIGILNYVFFNHRISEIRLARNTVYRDGYKKDNNYSNGTIDYLYNTFFIKPDFEFESNIFYSKQIYTLVVSDEFNSKIFCKDVIKEFYRYNPLDNLAYNILFMHLNNLSLSSKTLKYYMANFLQTIDLKYVPLWYLLKIYALIYQYQQMKLFMDISLDKLHTLIIKDVNDYSLSALNKIDWRKFPDRKLLDKVHNIQRKRFSNDSTFNIECKLINVLNNNTFIPDSNRWFRHVSILNIILNNKKIQNIIFDSENLKPINNLCNYLIVSIVKSNDSYKNHIIEFHYVFYFMKFLHHLLNGNVIKDNVLRVNIRNLWNVIGDCRKKLWNDVPKA